MRKGLTTLLVILLAVGAMLVSCKAEVGTPADELVAVSFEDGTSRAITATLEEFNKDNYYWKYAAEKADDSGLTSGETPSYDEDGALPVSEGNKGLGSGTGTGYKPYKIPGFSQGLWNFKLYAYKTKNATTGEYEDLVYYGEAKNVSLSRGGENTALVVVNPVAEGVGFIKIGTITFIPKKTGDTADQLKFIEVTNPDGSAVPGISYADDRYTVPAGIYKVTVKFANASQTIVYGEGYVIATVYAGLETVIGGNLSEMVTYAQFDADLNPDAVSVQAESEEIQFGTGDDVEIKTASTAEKEVKTSVARSDANAIIEAMAEEQGVDTGSSTKLKLTLNVDPTDATETTITYEIGMKATLTYTKDTQTQTSEKAVTALEKYVVVEIEMNSGLSDVTVKHSGVAMVKCDSLEELTNSSSTEPTHPGFYFYDAAGTLYIKTRTFSPFAISYTAPANYVASVDGVKYGTLAEAVAKIKVDGSSTVTLLSDVALTSTIDTVNSFTLDLAGYDITAANCRAIHVQEGTLTLTGKGTIAAGTAVSTFGASSSVIRVGNNAGTAAGLVIGKDVTISSSYCYGVSIFGTETNGQTLVVDGKVKVTGTASAISGNGTSTLTATTITINEGAEVYAENDYAIYHPQKGTLTVAGGTIVGKGGIEAKGGNVIVNGGAITATAPTQSHEEYNNGASTSGYALAAVKNPNYPGDGSIRVNGGMITGELILATDEEASFTTKLEAAGGTFTVDPTAYLAEGCVAIDNLDGTWSVLPEVVKKAMEYGLTVSGFGIETFNPSYAKVTKVGMAYADGTFNGDKTVYRYYADDKIYILDVSEVEGTSYTFREDVSGIRGYWSNDTINEITINSPLEQATKRFEQNTTITKVNFGSKATRIPARMFYKAYGISDVSLPSSVTYIESGAFSQSNATSIVVEAPVVIIEETAFAYCPYLKTIDIKGAATIGTKGVNNFVARACASLTDIYIRDAGTTFIGNNSMTFTHQESGNDAGEGITLHVVNETVFNAMKAFSGDYIFSKMTVVYPNNN